MNSQAITLSARVYGSLFVLYPRTFRTEFRNELVCHFLEGTQRAKDRGGAFDVARLWADYAVDFFWNLIIQWFRTGLPALIGISGCSTCLLVALLALQGIPQAHPLFRALHLLWLGAVVAVMSLSILLARYFSRRSI
jgi:hypothetical protein